MAGKIEIHDAKLSKRVDKIVSQLREAYPDGKVFSLNDRHKSLSNNVGEIWPLIGYESREDFFNAYGFKSERASRGGRPGRPATFDAEKLLEELSFRYKDAVPPRALNELVSENPDLKGPLKTFSNLSVGLYGKTVAKVLEERGLLRTGKATDDVTDGDIRAMLDVLAAKYTDETSKPSSVTGLKAENPEYKDAITAFSSRSEKMYGITAKKKLIELGIFAEQKAEVAVDAEEIENAIDELGEIFCALPSEEKPKTITDLSRPYPKQWALVKAGKKKGLADPDLLQELGILACTKTLLKKKGVRMVPYEELLPLVRDALGDIYIEPGDGQAKCLPPYIAGIDVKKEVELRCATVAVTDPFVRGLAIGKTYPARVFFEEDCWGQTILKVQIDNMPSMQVSHMWFGDIFDYVVEGSESKLSCFNEAAVATVSGYKGDFIAQIELKYLAALRRDTIIYALRQMGYVTEADVVGNMGWRFRLRKAARGKSVPGEPLDGSHEPGPADEGEAAKKAGKDKKKAKKKRKAEEARHAAGEVRAAEEARKAEEERESEEARKAEEARKVEEKRKVEEARKAEEAHAAEEARKAEEARRAKEEAERAEAAQRAEEERRAAEETRKAEEARKVEETRAAEESRRVAEEARRAEAERQARISAQEEKVQAAQAAFDKAKDELAEFELREAEISSLESQVRSLEQAIAGLGFFKFGEKKAKRQELSEVMTKMVDLKKQNLKMADKREAFAAAQEALNAEKTQLERL